MGAKELNLFDSIKNGNLNQAIKLLAKNSSSVSKKSNESCQSKLKRKTINLCEFSSYFFF